jgi:hypothetical protein
MQISNDLADQIKDCAVQLENIFDIKIRIGKKKSRNDFFFTMLGTVNDTDTNLDDFVIIQNNYESFIIEGGDDEKEGLANQSSTLVNFLIDFHKWIKAGIIVHYQWKDVPINGKQRWRWKENGDGQYIVEFYENSKLKSSLCAQRNYFNEPYRTYLLKHEDAICSGNQDGN